MPTGKASWQGGHILLRSIRRRGSWKHQRYSWSIYSLGLRKRCVCHAHRMCSCLSWCCSPCRSCQLRIIFSNTTMIVYSCVSCTFIRCRSGCTPLLCCHPVLAWNSQSRVAYILTRVQCKVNARTYRAREHTICLLSHRKLRGCVGVQGFGQSDSNACLYVGSDGERGVLAQKPILKGDIIVQVCSMCIVPSRSQRCIQGLPWAIQVPAFTRSGLLSR